MHCVQGRIFPFFSIPVCVQVSSFLFFLSFFLFFFIPDGESCFAWFPILFYSRWRIMFCVQESSFLFFILIFTKLTKFLSPSESLWQHLVAQSMARHRKIPRLSEIKATKYGL